MLLSPDVRVMLSEIAGLYNLRKNDIASDAPGDAWSTLLG
jgi:hypothetical protein